ncbi:sporulation protein YjcZ [Bacillus sp. UFRGS-B20]|nr:sporulation protein YjcZ [Bacillus sp. UFRGS-B20]
MLYLKIKGGKYPMGFQHGNGFALLVVLFYLLNP